MVFSPEEFRQTYPQFAGLTDTQLNNYWQLQLLYGDQIVANFDASQEKTIRFLIVAHFAQLASNSSGSGGFGGRVSSASKGSISATLSYNDDKAGYWWNKTVFGESIWNLINTISGATYYPSRKAICRNIRRRRLWP